MTGAKSMSGAELSLIGLSRRYGDHLAVDDVSLTAAPGEILALLGPSGCGKTTTLRMIAGLVQPSAGRIEIDGAAITDLPVHRRNLGMLFQNYALFPHLSVLDNVAFGLSMRGIAKGEITKLAKRALDMARMSGFEERMPAALSGGQQQRVALARAIAYRPRVLLLDEPFAALDRKLREEMQIEIRQLCNELGLTTILVTHDQEEALILADQIAVMRGGRIEQVASARAIYDRPVSHFVADFIGTSNFLPGTILETMPGLTRMRAAEGGMFESAVPHDLSPGEPASLAVRPESISLSPGASAPGVNQLSGRILRSVFKGQSLSVWLEIAPGRELIIALPIEQADASNPQPGEIWTARWPAGRALVVREQ